MNNARLLGVFCAYLTTLVVSNAAIGATVYTDRTIFESQLSTLVTDGYDDSGYFSRRYSQFFH